MEHESMVHALEEIRRTLKPNGILIDLRPVPRVSGSTGHRSAIPGCLEHDRLERGTFAVRTTIHRRTAEGRPRRACPTARGPGDRAPSAAQNGQ